MNEQEPKIGETVSTKIGDVLVECERLGEDAWHILASRGGEMLSSMSSKGFSTWMMARAYERQVSIWRFQEEQGSATQ